MRTFFTSILLFICSFSLISVDAHAGRFGGGRSFGVQRSHHHYSNQSSHQAYSKSAPKAQQLKSRWGSLLGGMLIGGLLASLFMGHGFATGLFSWLIVGSLIYMVFQLRKKWNPAFQNAGPRQSPFNFNTHSAWGSAQNQTSLNFNEEQFLRQAKVNFIRLQAAYDQKNEADLQSFLAPDIFAEIKMQLNERGALSNKTDVLNLDAQCLDVSQQVGAVLVSVKFSGRIQENNAAPIDFEEIWHIRQNAHYPFLVVGIQQEVIEAA